MIPALLSVILLLVCGALGASGFIISKKPDAKQLLDKLVPYQGIAGVAGVIWGLVGLLMLLVNIGAMLKASLFGTIIGIVGTAALIGTGFLLGFGLIMSLNKNPEARAKAEEARAKLIGYQVPMGIVCLVLGLLNVVNLL